MPRQDAVVRPATIKAQARVNPVILKIKSHFWIDWAEIAIENEAVARRARLELYPKDASEGLRTEKHAGMIAVSSSAHALDALYGELRDEIPLPDSLVDAWAKREAEKGKGPPRHARTSKPSSSALPSGRARPNGRRSSKISSTGEMLRSTRGGTSTSPSRTRPAPTPPPPTSPTDSSRPRTPSISCSTFFRRVQHSRERSCPPSRSGLATWAVRLNALA